MSKAIDNLLAAIRKHEAPKGYGQIYGGHGLPKGTDTDVSKMTLDQVRRLQAKMLAAQRGRPLRSSAVGGYQQLKNTLNMVASVLKLPGNTVFNAAVQDKMAMYLLRQRGLNRYLTGQISREAFANNLAAEWASLPMVTGPKKGRSKYAGDGVNKSFHSVASILALVDAIKAEHQKGNG